MDPEFRRMMLDRDEVALERAYFDDECGHFFQVDWREDDAATVGYCAECLDLDDLSAEWREGDLVISYQGKKITVPLSKDAADRHITVCTLNDVLSPDYEIRYFFCSHGTDTAGFAALPAREWEWLEKECSKTLAENFIDPRKLPNVMTELRDASLPTAARARHERMVEHNRRRP